MSENTSLPAWTDRRLIMCAGPGGVGKTTCAASIALTLAAHGKRVIAVTIDPSKRLAQSLGLSAENLQGEIAQIQNHGMTLDALVLNPRWVFDRVVRACFNEQARADAVMGHPMYRAAAEQLAGALEFAAMARVQMLLESNEYDTIVLDTPPTANALDFLRAPARLKRLVKNPATQIFVKTSKLGSALVGVGQATIYKVLEKIGGAEVLKQLEVFFRDFSQVLEVFYHHAEHFEATLHSQACGVVLVTTPTSVSVREACVFLEILASQKIARDALVLNQVDPPLLLEDDWQLSLQKLGATPQIVEAVQAAQIRGDIETLCLQLKSVAPEAGLHKVERWVHAPQTLEELEQLGRGLMTG